MNTRLNQYNEAIKRIGKQCTLNNSTSISGIFKELNDATKGIDTKGFLTSAELKQGDLIAYNNNVYMVITKNEIYNGVYTTYTIRKCPYTIKIDFDGTIKQFNMYTDKQTFELSNPSGGGVGVIPTNKIYVYVQNEENTNSIDLDPVKRLIKFGSAWKIIGIDKTVDGIIAYTCDFDTITFNDDMENEIAYEGYDYTITTNPTSIEIDTGATVQVTTTIKNHNMVVDATPQYSSNNTSIATVDSNGLVTGVSNGTCNITVSFIGLDGLTYTKVIGTTINVVHNYVLTAAPTDISINSDETSQITTTLTDNGDTVLEPTITYISSNTSIATVNSTGLVTAVGVGNCSITVSFIGENSITYNKTVSVSIEMAHNYILSVDPTTISVDEGSTSQITASVTDKGVQVSSPTFTYESSNTSIATVDATGLVTGVAEGSCNITVSFVGEDSQTYTEIIATTVNVVAPTGLVVTATPSSIDSSATTGQHITITMTVTDNGTDVTNTGYWFNFNSTDSTVGQITSTASDNLSCSVWIKKVGTCDIQATGFDPSYNQLDTVIIHIS